MGRALLERTRLSIYPLVAIFCRWGELASWDAFPPYRWHSRYCRCSRLSLLILPNSRVIVQLFWGGRLLGITVRGEDFQLWSFKITEEKRLGLFCCLFCEVWHCAYFSTTYKGWNNENRRPWSYAFWTEILKWMGSEHGRAYILLQSCFYYAVSNVEFHTLVQHSIS